MALEPVTAVTDDLLAMTWASQDAARTWFKRRKTEPQDLGLEFKEYPSDTGLRVRVVTAVAAGSAIDRAVFDEWANEVDALLSSANEEPESDQRLEDLFASGSSVQHAFDDIIARRTNALEAELSSAAEPETEPGAEPELTDDGTGPEVIEGGTEGTTVELDEPAGDPVVAHEVYRTGTLAEAEQAHADRQLAKSMEPTQTTYVLPEEVFLGDLLCILDSVHIPLAALVAEAAESVRHRLGMLAAPVTGPGPEPAQEAAQSPVEVIPEAAPEAATETVPEASAEPAQDVAQDITEEATAPASTRTRAAREARMRLIVGALETPEGITAKDVQKLLGWESTPNPWHFREWAKTAGRFNDLTDMGLVDGVRRWRLETRRR